MNSRSLPILISVFFFWGFVAASNDILIPVFKEKLGLEQWQSQMIQLAFYCAYTVGSIIYFFISKIMKKDVLNTIGYKNGLVLGLCISAVGTLFFYPAAQLVSFPLMITGLFIVGLGFSLQQTAANPLAIVMGDPKKGSQRLSLAGGVNNIGSTIAPHLVSYAIFGAISSQNTLANIESVKTPYLILGGAFLLVAIIFKFSNIPNKIPEVTEENNDQVTTKKSALAYPQLIMGMLAIFLYVGVEVSTAGNLSEFMKQHLHIETKNVAPYVSLFWASLMIGRWTSSADVFNLKGAGKHILRFILPYLAFGLFLGVNMIFSKTDIWEFRYYFPIILVMIIGDLLSKGNPAKQLMIYSVLGITALMIGILADGWISVYAFVSVGLFCSTLWPCIFTLAIKGLGKHTNQGSGFLIMMIMGGGIISALQGYLASDNILGIQWSYMVGVVCFAYLAFYALVTKGIFKKQHIEL